MTIEEIDRLDERGLLDQLERHTPIWEYYTIKGCLRGVTMLVPPDHRTIGATLQVALRKALVVQKFKSETAFYKPEDLERWFDLQRIPSHLR